MLVPAYGPGRALATSVPIVLDGNPPERYATSSDLPSQIADPLLPLDCEPDRQAWLDGMSSGWPTATERIVDDADARTDRVAREKSLVLAFLDAYRPFIHDQPTDPAREDGAWPSPGSRDSCAQASTKISPARTT